MPMRLSIAHLSSAFLILFFIVCDIVFLGCPSKSCRWGPALVKESQYYELPAPIFWRHLYIETHLSLLVVRFIVEWYVHGSPIGKFLSIFNSVFRRARPMFLLFVVEILSCLKMLLLPSRIFTKLILKHQSQSEFFQPTFIASTSDIFWMTKH